MTITTKYDIGQTVWWVHQSGPIEAKISEIKFRDCLRYEVRNTHNTGQRILWESQLFATIEEAKESITVE